MDIFELIGSAVCHQMVERSFIWNGQPFMVCARCTGIYMGIFVAMAFFLWNKRLEGNQPYSTPMAVLCAFAFFPIAIDGFFSYMGAWESNNLLRVVSGSLAGASIVGFVLLAANVSWKEKNEKPIYKNIWEQVLVWAISLALGIVFYLWDGFFVMALGMVSIGILCFWSGIFYMVLQGLSCHWKIKNGWISILCGLLMIVWIGGVRL